LSRGLPWPSRKNGLWQDKTIIRADLFGTERLEHHARTLAAAQPVTIQQPVRVPPLTRRVKDNADILLDTFRASAQALQSGETIPPAAEWLLDNFHLVEEQLRQIADDLPPGYYRQLPKLAEGPFVGYPRVLGIAWAYVAHTDSLLSASVLARFVKAYQEVQPLMIGELWAIAITLRIVLIENMRRLAVQITHARHLRKQANTIVDRVLEQSKSSAGRTGHTATKMLELAVAPYAEGPLPEIVAARIAKRLRGFDPVDTPLHGWLSERLAQQGVSIDTAVMHAQQRQGASNVTMRNIVTSMRLVSELDWADFFEDVSLIDQRLRDASNFADLDFATRNSYRTAIEVLSRGSAVSETEVTETALALAANGQDAVSRDPGHPLVGPGRSNLEAAIGFTPPFSIRAHRFLRRLGLRGYLGGIALASFLVLGLALWFSGATGPALLILALTGLAAAAEAGIALGNLVITRSITPRLLPGLDLAQGIPPDLRTLVAVPVLLSDTADLNNQIDQLEVHHLSSTGGALHFALLSDGPDAATETTPDDTRLIAEARAAIARLNDTYPSENGDRFLLLHRRRLWNPTEGMWIGWERKRGKLVELNRLLRGATDTTFMSPPSVPQDIRFVITLDADTRLLRDTVRRMVGKMAHPLNHAQSDPATGRVTSGYGILQPRVTPSLPLGQDGSLFQQVYSAPGGIEPYAAAISDVYQDLFDEGSFTGKGIYDVDAFTTALADRVPDNAMLSHDLFEGVLARAGLASDIELVEDFPARYDVATRRQHRWVRGDWQLLPWLTGRQSTRLPPVGRWKMLDNLRRSLTAPLSLLALFTGWLLPLPVAVFWSIAVLGMLALPRLLPLPFAILPGRAGITSRSHFAALAADTRSALAQIGLNIAFLADTAWQMGDAILCTLYRLRVSRRHLLQWITAARTGGGARPGLWGYYRKMAGGTALGLGVCAAALWLNPAAWPVLAGFGLLWAGAPALAHHISQPSQPAAEQSISTTDAQSLRLIARATWRYFETFVTEREHFLPPDNFQETPKPTIAHRTSPTNIGLYLLAITAARDMGWIGLSDAITRMEQTLQTMQRMARFRGHFYNWYDTRDLRVLDPAYVSSVDSGNLAGHLIAVAQACHDWQTHQPNPEDLRGGLRDTLLLAQQALTTEDRNLSTALDNFSRALDAHQAVTALQPLAAEAAALATPDTGAAFWTRALHDSLTAFIADQNDTPGTRLAALEQAARCFALDMEFGFLVDPDKKLLSIGFSVATNTPDPSCYDLLASEARLASLFAIAKGDVETRHWFRLGRAATPIGAGSALISWSGSMFEYLMPSLIMRAAAGSVLEQTNRLIVARQQSYAAAQHLPWGISESSYNARNLEMTYQYSNFGVPGLGLKRGLSENYVIAPYASGLATMVDPHAAVRNYERLAALGASGRYGFYEAVDFTRSRLPADANHAIVRSFMAHHQGMTIAAIANTVQDGRLRTRFHAVPMIRAVDLLLQERVPRDATVAPPRATEVLTAPVDAADPAILRRYDAPAEAAPTAHLLSNGTYGVMLTPSGAGFSRWRDLAITRWRADATQAAHGSFIFARDVDSGALWSAGVLPTRANSDRHIAVFCDHHAAFTHRRDRLTTMTEILVSAEDDAEARRVTLTNAGRQPREVDLTSYAELALAPPSADQAHPAFSKMFVVTDYLPELGVLIATRRKRTPSDTEVWAAHIAVVEGTETAPLQHETDRARFIGRGHDIGQAAMANAPLSGTTGTVLDPIFSLRRRVTIPPGGRARVTFWTMVASSPDALLDLVDRHRDPSAFDRAMTLSWTQAQVQLRHLGMTQVAAAEFQQLGGMLIRGDARLRASPRQIESGAGPQSELWPLGISGDLPIVLFRISDAEDVGHLHEVLAAHEYWRMRQLAVDLVILNERASSYVQDLQTAIEVAIRSAQTRPRSEAGHGATQGTIYTLRTDLMLSGARDMLLAVASVVLQARRGSIGQQLDALPPLPATPQPRALRPPASPAPKAQPPLPDLTFFNGTGGFSPDGREYVTVLDKGATTPAPWINVVANPGFGFQVSAEGSGSAWAENSRENQLTPWSNDPVTDPAGEAIYLRDLQSGAIWTPTALPIRSQGRYTARHGFGYSRFLHDAHGINTEMLQFVPLDAPVKVTRLTLHNHSGETRQLSVTGYAEWVLGTSRSATAHHVVTEIDSDTGAILARNPYTTAFPGRIAFADLGADVSSRSGDRSAFLGRGGRMADPLALHQPALNDRAGAGLDPCAALQRTLTLAPGESKEVTFLLGQTGTREDTVALIHRMRSADLDALLQDVHAHWHDVLDAVQISTPDRATDLMLNGWLLYQTLACRIWARAGFYQASGAYGFRDQLQDGMALTFTRPDLTREHLLRAAGRQFPEGDVQHWWLPHSGQGVRTRISDDRVWLGYGVAQYVAVTGDHSILDEDIPFLDGPALLPGAHDDFFQPGQSDTTASLFEHCARGLDQAIVLTGENGMPLIGTGDWNDGMNRVGEHGTGTSVWLGWLLIDTLGKMDALGDQRDPDRAAAWRKHAESVRQAIERDGWDGEWYRRGTFDDGTILGTSEALECRIDSIAQSWAVLSGAADPVRAATAMESLTTHLVRHDPGLALLFTPPFDQTPLDPGYIKGYPPGLRENGGQYSHAAMWAILAHARLGDGDAAGGLFALVNPINHSRTPSDMQRYKVEPYVIAADVYSTAPHAGRGGWTWYTGSAGWMYRAGIEGLLGLTWQQPVLRLNPCFPRDWPQVSATVRHGDTHFEIVIDNGAGAGHGISSARIDGTDTAIDVTGLALPLSGGKHRVEVTLG